MWAQLDVLSPAGSALPDVARHPREVGAQPLAEGQVPQVGPRPETSCQFGKSLWGPLPCEGTASGLGAGSQAGQRQPPTVLGRALGSLKTPGSALRSAVHLGLTLGPKAAEAES